jgi:hypothetical protein
VAPTIVTSAAHAPPRIERRRYSANPGPTRTRIM